MSEEATKSILHIGNVLRALQGDTTAKPLPKRWIDLILHLDEEERKQSACSQAEIELRQRSK